MAKPDSITRPFHPAPRPHPDVLAAYLKVARTATDKALSALPPESGCPDLRFLVERAHDNLAAAHDLFRTDRGWAA